MFNALTVFTTIVLYMGILFLIAMLIERKFLQGVNIANNPYIYSLSLAVYCTTWTYYGSIGKAATSGFLFLTIYLGPTLTFILGWTVIRKMARIKSAKRITSIADFISARYKRSQALAAMVTFFALVGVAPYIALQLKAIISTFKMVTASGSGPLDSWITNNMGPIVVLVMIIFTNIFGVRRLDPTERHPGMVIAVAIESMVKLVAFLTVGIFVTYFMFDGMGDIFKRVTESDFIFIQTRKGSYYVTYTTYIILAMSAIMFLPRQFHVSVIENSDDRHIRTAMWLFPLYMFLINIFVFPIAMGGLLKGYPAQQADTFLLSLPMSMDKTWLSLFVFIGGFSAGTSMIMICSMTMSTMMTNHLLLPVVGWFEKLGFLRRQLLKCRWVAVALVIGLGYWFEKVLGGSYMLVNMGMISFAAVLQFAPAIIGGIFWNRANKVGALLGIAGGFLMWFYTLLLPSFIKSGWLSQTILEFGPWEFVFLKPEQFLGLAALDPMSHAVFWSMVFNIGLFVGGSLFFRQGKEEKRLAMEFVNVLIEGTKTSRLIKSGGLVKIGNKIKKIKDILVQYFTELEAEVMIEKSIKKMDITDKNQISIPELGELYAEIERNLAGAIGAASAHHAMSKKDLFSQEEAEELSSIYGEIIARLNLTPEQLKEKIDYYQERELMLTDHGKELEEKIKEREKEISLRKKMENEVRRLNEDLENLVGERTSELEVVNKELEAFAYSVSHDLRAPLRTIDGFSLALLEDYEKNLDDEGKDFLRRIRKGSQKMAELIDHILQLSRLTHAKINLKKINLSRMSREIVEDFHKNQPDRIVDFVIQDKVVVDGDEVLLRRVMENLLGNAWKYTSMHNSARIEFGVMNNNGQNTYFVRDDGAGFDMAHSEKLFGIFQRLHANGEFEGTGVGLATTQRILIKLGGKIWAEGAVEQGATFYFTIGDRDITSE